MLRGRRIVLRPVEDSDVPHIHRWMNHPVVWRNMDYERPVSLEDVREDVERSRTDGVPFTIEADGRPIGRIGLNRFRRRDRIAAMYLYIGEPEFWGHGYAQEALDTMLAYAFDRFDLWQVELWTLADNEKAIRVYTKCGFVQEGTLRDRSWKEGRWVGHLVMSVRRDEFSAARQERSGT
jgi:RimJ/RimL family protein N-acetyltransferase